MSLNQNSLPTVPAREKEVAQELNNLRQITELVGELAGKLHDSIKPVLSTSKEVGGRDVKAGEPPICDLASEIRSNRYLLRDALDLLQDAITRLEI